MQIAQREAVLWLVRLQPDDLLVQRNGLGQLLLADVVFGHHGKAPGGFLCPVDPLVEVAQDVGNGDILGVGPRHQLIVFDGSFKLALLGMLFCLLEGFFHGRNCGKRRPWRFPKRVSQW